MSTMFSYWVKSWAQSCKINCISNLYFFFKWTEASQTFYLNLLPMLGSHITQLTSDQLWAEEQNHFEFCLSLPVWGNLSRNLSSESTNMPLTGLAWAEVTGGDNISWHSKSPLCYFPYAKLHGVKEIWRGEQLEIQ